MSSTITPVVYHEAWRWQGEGVTDPWWGAETSAGDLSHTEQDRVEAINPAIVEATAEVLVTTTHALATETDVIPAR